MPKKFKVEVEKFQDLSDNFDLINEHLKTLNNAFQRIDWGKLPRKKGKRPGDPDEEPGSKGGKWPP
jgi:hypothetical protein